MPVNGKAERFIQASLREWAYAQPFETSAIRRVAMLPWITGYNSGRPHSAIGGRSPLERIAELNTVITTTPADRHDPKPAFVGLVGVKPRTATAAATRA